MAIGIALLFIGYALVYWGRSHFPGQQRYSLWTLLGIPNMTPGTPVQYKVSGS